MIIWRAAWLAVMAALSMAPAQAASTPTRPLLLVISLDGFRNEYLSRGLTPNLAALAAAGVKAAAMRPAFPSVTSPNHYTLMTGLWPDHHGIVDNEFVDPAMGGAAFGAPKTDYADPRWWKAATPLWVTAQHAGLTTAANDWPGDDAVAVDGSRITYVVRAGRGSAPTVLKAQTDGVLAWIDLPPAQRPALILLHFDPVDFAGHLFGPDSPQVNTAIGQVDAAVGELVAGLKARGLEDKVDLVIVSDHGMAPISPQKVILLDDLIDPARGVVPTFGAETGFNPDPDYRAQAEKILLAAHDHMTCWRRSQIPARLHYGSNPRVPQIFCLTEVGWSAGTRAQFKRYPKLSGNHGYDPAEPSMKAIFIAHGPAFRRGVTVPEFDNVEVYPTLARVLGVKAEHADGGVIAGALR